MHDDDRWDDAIREAYQRPMAGEEYARERAIARLGRERARDGHGGWWLNPDALRIRPLLAVASLIAVLAIGAWGGAWWMASHRVPEHLPRHAELTDGPTAAAVNDDSLTVTFMFRAPGASRVCLVGDFNDWDPNATPLRRAALGDAWTARVPLRRGLHAYAFVIDGSDWATDPLAPLAPAATFGRRNSVVVVGEGGAL